MSSMTHAKCNKQVTYFYIYCTSDRVKCIHTQLVNHKLTKSQHLISLQAAVRQCFLLNTQCWQFGGWLIFSQSLLSPMLMLPEALRGSHWNRCHSAWPSTLTCSLTATQECCTGLQLPYSYPMPCVWSGDWQCCPDGQYTYSIIVSRLYVRSSEVQATFDKLQRIQNNLTRVVCPGGGCNDDGPLLRSSTGFQWGSRSCTKRLWQPTWCRAQQYQQTLAMTRSLWSSNAKLWSYLQPI